MKRDEIYAKANALVRRIVVPMNASPDGGSPSAVDQLCELIHQYRLDERTSVRLVHAVCAVLRADENAPDVKRGALRVLAAMSTESSGSELPSSLRLTAFQCLATLLEQASRVSELSELTTCLGELTHYGARLDPFGAQLGVLLERVLSKLATADVGSASPVRVAVAVAPLLKMTHAWLRQPKYHSVQGANESASAPTDGRAPPAAYLSPPRSLHTLFVGLLRAVAALLARVSDAQAPTAPLAQQQLMSAELRMAESTLAIFDAALSFDASDGGRRSGGTQEGDDEQRSDDGDPQSPAAAPAAHDGDEDPEIVKLVIVSLCRVVNVSSCSAASWQLARRVLSRPLGGPFGIQCLCEVLAMAPNAQPSVARSHQQKRSPSNASPDSLAAAARAAATGDSGRSLSPAAGQNKSPPLPPTYATPSPRPSRSDTPPSLRVNPLSVSGGNAPRFGTPSPRTDGNSPSPTSMATAAAARPRSSSLTMISESNDNRQSQRQDQQDQEHEQEQQQQQQLLAHQERRSVKLLRGAVFLLGMACWSSQRLESLDVPSAALVPALLAALDFGEPIVVYEVSLAVCRLVKKYGARLVAEWPLVWRVIARLEPLVRSRAPSQSARQAFRNVLRDTVGAVEQVHAAGRFRGDARELHAAQALAAPYQSAEVLATQLRARGADVLDVSRADDWAARAHHFAMTYFRREQRPAVRLAALQQLAQVYAAHRQLCAVELVDKVALPVLGAAATDEPNAEVARAVVRFFGDVAAHLTSSQFFDLVNVLQRAAVMAVGGPIVRVVATIALVDIFRAKFARAPAAHALHVAAALVGLLDQPEPGVRYQVLTLIGQLGATPLGSLLIDGQMSPYIRCFSRKTHGSGAGDSGNSNVWPMNPVVDALGRRLRHEDDATNFLLTLRGLQTLLNDRCVLAGVDLRPLLHELCELLSDGSLGSQLQASTTDRDSVYYLAFDVLSHVALGSFNIQMVSTADAGADGGGGEPVPTPVNVPIPQSDQIAVINVFVHNLRERARQHHRATLMPQAVASRPSNRNHVRMGLLHKSPPPAPPPSPMRAREPRRGLWGGKKSPRAPAAPEPVPMMTVGATNGDGYEESSNDESNRSNLDVARMCLNSLAVCVCEFGSPTNFPAATWSSVLESCSTLGTVPGMVPLVLQLFNLIATVLGREGLTELARQEWLAAGRREKLDESLLRVIRLLLRVGATAEKQLPDGTPSADAALAYQVLGRWFLAMPLWRRVSVLPLIEESLEQQRLPPCRSVLAEACLGMFGRYALTDGEPRNSPLVTRSQLFVDAGPPSHWLFGNAVLSVRAGALGFFEVVMRRPHGCDVWLMQVDPSARDSSAAPADNGWIANFVLDDEAAQAQATSGADQMLARQIEHIDQLIDPKRRQELVRQEAEKTQSKTKLQLWDEKHARKNRGDREPKTSEHARQLSVSTSELTKASSYPMWTGSSANSPATSAAVQPTTATRKSAAKHGDAETEQAADRRRLSLTGDTDNAGDGNNGSDQQSATETTERVSTRVGSLESAPNLPRAFMSSSRLLLPGFDSEAPDSSTRHSSTSPPRSLLQNAKSTPSHVRQLSTDSSDSFAPLLSYGDDDAVVDAGASDGVATSEASTSRARRDDELRAAQEIMAPGGDDDLLLEEETTKTMSVKGHRTSRQQREQAPEKSVEGQTNREAAAREQLKAMLSAGFVAQQLTQVPFKDERPVALPDSDQLKRALGVLDRTFCIKTHKIGVLYVAPGQREARQFLGNQCGSPRYSRFLQALGTVTRLASSDHQYTGGLDRSARAADGEFGLMWRDNFTQVVFHVATFMPSRPKEDPGFTNKLRHIGNNYVNIVFSEADWFGEGAVGGGPPPDPDRPVAASPSKPKQQRTAADFHYHHQADSLPFDPQCIKGQFNFVNVVVSPRPGNVYSVAVLANRAGLPSFGPITKSQLVSEGALPHLIRHTALSADVAAGQFLDGQAPRPSNAETRLKQIQALRELKTK